MDAVASDKSEFMPLTLAFDRELAGWIWSRDPISGYSLFVSPDGQQLVCVQRRGGWLTRPPFDRHRKALVDF